MLCVRDSHNVFLEPVLASNEADSTGVYTVTRLTGSLVVLRQSVMNHFELLLPIVLPYSAGCSLLQSLLCALWALKSSSLLGILARQRRFGVKVFLFIDKLTSQTNEPYADFKVPATRLRPFSYQ